MTPVSGLATAPERRAGARSLLLPREAILTLRTDPRRAVEEDNICCLLCGRTFRQLTNTHLGAHGTSAPEYKRRFGYNRRRPLMCRELQRLYADRAVRTGLAERIRTRPILVQPDLRRRGGTRPIALEERLTRQEAQRRRPAPPSLPRVIAIG